MTRPVKWRRVEYIHENKYFAPCPKGKGGCFEGLQEVQLKVEELEAMRLKDIEELSQEDCASRMQISRQTFQNIIVEARKKVVTALMENRALTIGGGHYTKNVCNLKCISCGNIPSHVYTSDGSPICEDCSKKMSENSILVDVETVKD